MRAMRTAWFPRRGNHAVPRGTGSERIVRGGTARWKRRHVCRYGTPGLQLLVKEYVIGTALSANGLQLSPLLHRKHLPQVEGHGSEFAFQFAPGREHLVHLGSDLAFIGHVRIEKALQFEVFLLHLSLVVDQLHAMVVENLVQLPELALAELQFFCYVGVLPPLAHFVTNHHLSGSRVRPDNQPAS